MPFASPQASYAVSDGALLTRVSRGDPGALERIRERYSLTIYAIAYGLLLDARRAETVVDETFAVCAQEDGGGGEQPLFDLLTVTARRLSRESVCLPDVP
jgi:DNA-directed RNA polymerase specialized sigma24 family protein